MRPAENLAIAPDLPLRADRGRGADTFCNIYVSDVTCAMYAEIPIMRANDVVGWLRTAGEQRGWHRADAHD